jgi:hypothetical protein
MATSDLCFVSFKKTLALLFFSPYSFFLLEKKKNFVPLALDFSRDSNPNEAATTASVVRRAIAVSFGNASATILCFVECFGGGRSACFFVFCYMF